VALFSLALVLGVFAVPPAAAVGLWLWTQRVNRRDGLPRFARWSTYTLVGVAGVISAGTVVGLIQSVIALRAPGMSAAQKQSVVANEVAEAMYSGAFGVLLVVVGALWVGFVRWGASRRR
jgi:hypothetical protein